MIYYIERVALGHDRSGKASRVVVSLPEPDLAKARRLFEQERRHYRRGEFVRLRAGRNDHALT